MVRMTIGSMKTTMPKTSIQFCARADRRPAMMSIRMCSLRLKHVAGQSRKIAENMYHWISSSPFELSFRT